MAKQFIFYREDLINTLLNYKIYFSEKYMELIKQGIDPKNHTFIEAQIHVWTEEFLDDQLKRSEIKLESILDEVDEILKTTHGMSTMDVAKRKKEDES